MLLQLKNTTEANVQKLMAFAKENGMQLSLMDDSLNEIYLPGKALSDQQLTNLINQSRKSGTISLEDGHSLIRNRNED